MPFGLLTGLTAALFWGTLDVITALASRVIGSLRVTAGMQSVTAVLFLVIFVATGATIPTDPASIALAVLLGLIGAGAYLSYFTGLQFGPIAVVSGMVSAFGGLTVVLSVVIRGESLSPAPGVRCGGRDGRRAADRVRLRWRAARDPVRRPGRRLRPCRARAVLAHGDHHRRGSRDDVLDPDLHDRPGRERVDRDRRGPASWRGARGARSGIDRRAVPAGRTRASSGHSCSSECSTSSD